MADEPERTEGEPTPAPAGDAPQWATDLKQAIEGLPNKLRATVSDDDKRGIAESVHGLFESSGAFESAPPVEQQAKEGEQETEREQQSTEREATPAKQGKLSKFASWFAGEG